MTAKTEKCPCGARHGGRPTPHRDATEREARLGQRAYDQLREHVGASDATMVVPATPPDPFPWNVPLSNTPPAINVRPGWGSSDASFEWTMESGQLTGEQVRWLQEAAGGQVRQFREGHPQEPERWPTPCDSMMRTGLASVRAQRPTHDQVNELATNWREFVAGEAARRPTRTQDLGSHLLTGTGHTVMVGPLRIDVQRMLGMANVQVFRAHQRFDRISDRERTLVLLTSTERAREPWWAEYRSISLEGTGFRRTEQGGPVPLLRISRR